LVRAIAIASQKGGVGKTTTSINLSAYLASAGCRVLLVDLDPQGNATSGLSAPAPAKSPIRDLWQGTTTWASAATPTGFEGLAVVPSPPGAAVPLELADLHGTRSSELRSRLEETSPGWEYVILDCPPSIGPLTGLALQWADSVLVPVQCEYFAMEGLAQMLQVIEQAERSRSRRLELEGILLTLFSPELELAIEVVQEVRKHFPRSVLETIIPRDVALAEATSHGEPICRYAPRSRGAWAYLNLAKEILQHECSEAR
jgi:chromosome partitioning protein